MRLDSTTTAFGTVRTVAALTACLMSTAAPALADAKLARRGAGEHRPPVQQQWGTSSRRDDADAAGDIVVYVDATNAAERRAGPTATRATSDQEHLIAELRAWQSMPANWDGEGALEPVQSTLRAASNFVCLLGRESPMPVPMLHASGNAGLVWDDSASYAELEFLPDGKVVYYVSGNAGKHKGFVEFDGRNVPAPLRPLIPT